MEISTFRLAILNAFLILLFGFLLFSHIGLEISVSRLPEQKTEQSSIPSSPLTQLRLSEQNQDNLPFYYFSNKNGASYESSINSATRVNLHKRDFALPTIPFLTLIPGLYPSSTSTSTPGSTSGATVSATASATVTSSPTTPSANNPIASIISVVEGAGAQPSSGSSGSNPFQQIGNLLSEGFSGIGSAILGSLDTPAFFLGIGLGTGAITGLNLSTPDNANSIATQVASANGVSATGVNEIALNVGDGLAATIIPLVDEPNKPLNLTLIVPLVFPFAEGIANGTLVGLDISLKSFAPLTGSNLEDLAANVALGLSEAFASNLDFNKLKNLTSSEFSISSSGLDFSLIAENAGEGLSLGTVIGLGITQQSTGFTAIPPNSDNFTQVIPVVVKDFTVGLSSAFLENVDFSLLSQKLQGATSSVTTKINIPLIVEGFIRGAVDGIVDGITVAGGISNFINGKMPSDALARPDAPGTTFDDSVDGVAVAFGRGLANEAILQVGLAISKKANSSTPATKLRRSTIDNVLSTTQGPIINSTFLSFLVQQGVDNLQCKGVGGIGSVFLGLQDSKLLSPSMLGLSNTTTSLLPTTPLTITLDGNRFTFGLQSVTDSLYINGLSMKTFTYLTVLHVLFSIAALFMALPIFIILDSVQHILVMANKSSPTWIHHFHRVTIYLLLPMFAVLGVIFGFVAMGNSKQLRTPHGIIGFLVTLLSILFVILYVKDARRHNLHSEAQAKSQRYGLRYVAFTGVIMIFAFITFILGFVDLRSFTMCFVEAEVSLPVAILLGSTATALTIAAITVASLRMWATRLTNNRVTQLEEKSVPLDMNTVPE